MVQVSENTKWGAGYPSHSLALSPVPSYGRTGFEELREPLPYKIRPRFCHRSLLCSKWQRKYTVTRNLFFNNRSEQMEGRGEIRGGKRATTLTFLSSSPQAVQTLGRCQRRVCFVARAVWTLGSSVTSSSDVECHPAPSNGWTFSLSNFRFSL